MIPTHFNRTRFRLHHRGKGGKENLNARNKRKGLGRNSRYITTPASSGGISLTRLQAEKRRRELEHEKEKEAQRFKEKLEVFCGPISSGKMMF